ncbi:hypothetical protein BRD17_08595 [Halobacteriales archaeon SW_7_68_16]|nr:MAG: hypothetical protein BRD17_08595 [Halobacteriales archaeon SW_7_68_16]
METTRRRVLAGLAAGTVGLAGCSGGGSEPTAAGTIRIGLLEPLSGLFAYHGRQAAAGFLTGLSAAPGTEPPTDLASGVRTVTDGDVTYEVLVRDTRGDVGRAADAADALVRRRQVDLLAGCASSAAAARVLDTTAIPTAAPMLVGPADDPVLTATDALCRAVYRFGETTAMDARATFRHLEAEGIGSVYLVGPRNDDEPGLVEVYRRAATNSSVSLAGRQRVDQGRSAWSDTFDAVRSSGADAVLAPLGPATLPRLLAARARADTSFRVSAPLTDRLLARQVGAALDDVLDATTADAIRAAGIGPVTTRYAPGHYVEETTADFVDRFASAYGTAPDAPAAGMFVAGTALAQAVAETAATDVRTVETALDGMSVTTTPKGEGAYTLQSNGQAASPYTVAPLVPTTGSGTGTGTGTTTPTETPTGARSNATWADGDASVEPGTVADRLLAEDLPLPPSSDAVSCSR